jgi:hypothetical protein
MFDFFAAAATPLQTSPSPSNASPFSMTPDSQLSTFPTTSAASNEAPLAPGDLMPPSPTVDLGSNSPMTSSEVPATTPPIIIVVTSETPEDVGNPDPDIFFFPF